MRKLMLFVSMIALAGLVIGCSATTGGTKEKAAKPSTEYAYDAEKQALTVTFATGTYLYKGVPADVYSQIESAESKGKTFNELVKGKYPSTKVE